MGPDSGRGTRGVPGNVAEENLLGERRRGGEDRGQGGGGAAPPDLPLIQPPPLCNGTAFQESLGWPVKPIGQSARTGLRLFGNKYAGSNF